MLFSVFNCRAGYTYKKGAAASFMIRRFQRIGCLSALVFVPALGAMLMAEGTGAAGTVKQVVKPTKEQVFSKENIDKISESYGHFIYKSLENPVLHLDYDSVVRGLKEGKAGKPSPMTEQEYEAAIAAVQEIALKDMAEKNLKSAEEFLAKNAKETGVVTLDGGKIQYKITSSGNGEVISDSVVPVLFYSGKYLDGTVFGSSQESKEPIVINLKHTIPGFREGMKGMKVGEKRTIFIHPEQGYGTSGQLLPNSLLIFEIELVRLDPAPKDEVADDTAGDDEDSDDADDGDDDGDDADVGDDDGDDDSDDDCDDSDDDDEDQGKVS
jgi:peptidylprolyl isomerase